MTTLHAVKGNAGRLGISLGAAGGSLRHGRFHPRLRLAGGPPPPRKLGTSPSRGGEARPSGRLTVSRFGGVLALLLLAAACSSPPLALVASSPGSIAVGGQQRLLMSLIDPETQEVLASPDVSASADFTGPNDETIQDVALEFLWAVPDVRGLYRASVDFPTPGRWNVSVSADEFGTTEPIPLTVSEDPAMPTVGEEAPATPTRTAAEHPLEEITSDTDPEPSFYDLSLDEALADDRPTVVVFATPAFCTSETCGPVLDQAKAVATDHPGADFVHVEIYENLDADSFEDLVPVPAVEEWALPSEPWVFVTDSDGQITARFEGAYAVSELETALGEVGA